MTTGGEGGMFLTNDTVLFEKAWSFKDHGKSYAAVFRRSHPQGFRWLHESFGSNYRMTEMQAAIGLRQLAKLPQWRAARQRNAALLDAGLRGTIGLRIPVPPPEIGHARYKYYAFIDQAALAPDWNVGRIIQAIEAEGVPCASGSCPEIYRELVFVNLGLGTFDRMRLGLKFCE